MQDNSKIAQFFAEIQDTMKQKFRGWENDIPHQGEKGGIRERRVTDFLLSILPKKYGIGTGHIIDSQEQPVISHQTDIVIYDALNGIALPVDNYYSLFPCECVYATIEVKSRLTASNGDGGSLGTILECLKSTTRLKALNRAELQPIHSIVFAYETAWENNQSEHVKKWFESLGKTHSLKLPEIVFVLSPGFVLGSASPSGYNIKNKLSHLYERDPLLFFASDLVHRLSQTKVNVPNLWYEYNKWRKGDVIAKIYKE